MAKIQLNIYGKDDEITNTYQTDHVRWGLLMSALELQEKIGDSDPAEQMDAINEFAKEIFSGLTDEDLRNADSADVLNVITQVGKMAGKLNGSKNV